MCVNVVRRETFDHLKKLFTYVDWDAAAVVVQI